MLLRWMNVRLDSAWTRFGTTKTNKKKMRVHGIQRVHDICNEEGRERIEILATHTHTQQDVISNLPNHPTPMRPQGRFEFFAEGRRFRVF